MLKYINTRVVFQEIPDETTLAINLSNCPCHCPGCHSRFLWRDEGFPLTVTSMENLLERYLKDITCICFMGGDADPACINELAAYLRHAHPEYRVGWFSGRTLLHPAIQKENFDYIKIGPYIKHLGGLKEPTTNQRLYKIETDNQSIDITYRFWSRPEI